MEAVCKVTRRVGQPVGITLDSSNLTVAWVDPKGFAKTTRVCFGAAGYGTGLHVHDKIIAANNITDTDGIKDQLMTECDLAMRIRRPPPPPPETAPPRTPVREPRCSKGARRKWKKKVPPDIQLEPIPEEPPGDDRASSQSRSGRASSLRCAAIDWPWRSLTRDKLRQRCQVTDIRGRARDVRPGPIFAGQPTTTPAFADARQMRQRCRATDIRRHTRDVRPTDAPPAGAAD